MKFEIIKADKSAAIRVTTEVSLDAFRYASLNSRTAFDANGEPVFVIEIGNDNCLTHHGMTLSAQSTIYTIKALKASSSKALKMDLGLIKKYADQIESQVQAEYSDLEELANQIEEC